MDIIAKNKSQRIRQGLEKSEVGVGFQVDPISKTRQLGQPNLYTSLLVVTTTISNTKKYIPNSFNIFLMKSNIWVLCKAKLIKNRLPWQPY